MNIGPERQAAPGNKDRLRNSMKKPTPRKHQQFKSAFMHKAPNVQPFPEDIQRLVNRYSATHGGIDHMNLDAWRDLEQQLNLRK